MPASCYPPPGSPRRPDAEYLRPGTAAANVKDSTLDGFFMIGGVPVPAIRELAAETPIRLIPVDDDILAKIRESSTAYRRSVIPAGTYPGDQRGDTIDRLQRTLDCVSRRCPTN